jgi:SAM-dependent methyltransferase
VTPRFTVDFGSGATPEPDGRLHAPAFARNHEPIWAAIGAWLAAQSGDVLELASGTGQHTAAYAARAPHLTWWPSDMDNAAHFASIKAWRDAAGATNLRDPQRIDLMDAGWTMAGGPSPGTLTAMLAVNVTHISPWAATQNLIAGAGRWLRPGGRLFVYGPFTKDGIHTAPSNAQFDASLRAGNPAWGVRDVAALATLGKTADVPLIETVAMPANNFTLIFERASSRARS